MEKEFETAKVELNDGALYGMSDGAKMDAKSSIIEYVDNAEDANASKVSIIIDNERHVLTVLSVEETDLEKKDYKKLFNLGVSGKLHTKLNGVGKYSQGFKFAGPSLIGAGNKGEVKVAVRPISGNNWGATQFIDYTNDGNYTDKQIIFTDDNEIPQGYNFMVKVTGCKSITDNDIIKLSVELGVRYREKIEKGSTYIEINGIEVISQDRLYSKYGKRVDYHSPIYLEWKGDEKAATWEWSDLRKTEFNDSELIDYDTTLGIKGREKGTSVSSRSCLEVAINGVSIIYEKELINITGIQPQPSSSGFRGRLNILNRDLADEYIKGGNKSCCTVNKSFSINNDTSIIRQQVKDAYYSIINRYHNDSTKDKKYFSISKLDEWCEFNNIDCTFKFSDDNETVEAFIYDKNDNRIIVNTNSSFMKHFQNDASKCMIIIANINNIKNRSVEDIFKCLRKFKNECENNNIIS